MDRRFSNRGSQGGTSGSVRKPKVSFLLGVGFQGAPTLSFSNLSTIVNALGSWTSCMTSPNPPNLPLA